PAVLEAAAGRMEPDFAIRIQQRAVKRPELIDDDLRALLIHVELAARDHRLLAGDERLVLLIGLGPCDCLDDTVAILQRKSRVALARLVVLELDGLDYSGKLHLASVGRRGKVGRGQAADARDHAFVFVERMGGDVEAERLFLVLEDLPLVPFLHRLAAWSRGRLCHWTAEQPHLISFGITLRLL